MRKRFKEWMVSFDPVPILECLGFGALAALAASAGALLARTGLLLLELL